MENTKFTQGNWIIANSGGNVICHNGIRYENIATLEKSPLLITPEIEANARLISAAPDMLSVLKEAVEHAHVYDTNPALIELFKAVINKALN
jgi:hypothetical protein